MTIWSWARSRLARAFSSWSFLPLSSSASFSTRFRRCTSKALRRKCSSATAISATSSRPSISTLASRSPAAIRCIRSDSRPSRRNSTRPTNSQAISTAPTTLRALNASRRLRPVEIARPETRVASSALARAAFTKPSTSTRSSVARS